MDCVDSPPGDHRYDAPLGVAVNVVEPPAQIVFVPIMPAVGNALTTTCVVAVIVQPAIPVTVTV